MVQFFKNTAPPLPQKKTPKKSIFERPIFYHLSENSNNTVNSIMSAKHLVY